MFSLNRTHLRMVLTGLILTLSFAHSVNAIVTPLSPGPGDSFNQGSTCTTTWAGDSGSNWGDMTIELMSGSNFQMVHVKTVGTSLDGNKDGRLDFECPEVDPYAAIYFFQFSSPSTRDLTWTTRFTIADRDGRSVAPGETTQPDGALIPWGVGSVLDVAIGAGSGSIAITSIPPVTDAAPTSTSTLDNISTTGSTTDGTTTSTSQAGQTSPTSGAVSSTVSHTGPAPPASSPTSTPGSSSSGSNGSSTHGNSSNSDSENTGSGRKQCRRKVSKRGHPGRSSLGQ
ncbi:hypothetical protein E1B28_008031 [Marasmius oreades]|uniref:Yeast cell wall synthesis Kre9/Knh1-like N-terminal domain-containing protein n=1 Tax=Marasmius oreades TaxID=181124 RepID=A0A9P7S479_9AGAR|nr:uncharacterized protein E1B28_008031 [Marasmius oreades]XP_043010902.1 uncharacterized protein E1B28_008031 [Marasmius oreades]KAG7094431.1 hypothetical protein E1B28_008031 [Marasmius oreades]KAG7094432.1 hypothetical protein E1B28_008031 [Marasmius oreades]